MNLSPEPDTRHPIALRLALWAGRPFGVVFVPEMHVQVIRRMGMYTGVRGPGLTRYNPWTESLGPLVRIGGQKHQYTIERLMSRDGLPFTVRLSALFGYDPRVAPDLAPMLTRLPPDVIASLTRTFIEWAVPLAVNKYQATELTLHEVRAKIEQEVTDVLKQEIGFLGIQMRGARPIQILRIEPPTTLIDRHEAIAQRRASILAGTEFHASEFRRALVTEFIEHLARTGAGEAIINFNDVLDSYIAEHKPGASPKPIIDNPPQSVLGKDEGTRPASKPPRSRLDDADSRTPSRPKSRL